MGISKVRISMIRINKVGHSSKHDSHLNSLRVQTELRSRIE